jgi:hypothetical protein
MLLDALPRHLAGRATASGAVQTADTTCEAHYTRYGAQVART